MTGTIGTASKGVIITRTFREDVDCMNPNCVLSAAYQGGSGAKTGSGKTGDEKVGENVTKCDGSNSK